ncbi:MAG: hypothetical protein AB9882_06015 [Ignavibacteriaceae bacterium]
MHLTNLILVLIYLFSGTVLAGFGRISITTEYTISRKSNTPKPHYLSNVRLQKHILPTLRYDTAPGSDIPPSTGEKIALPSFIIGFQPAPPFRSAVLFVNLTNKAPPVP